MYVYTQAVILWRWYIPLYSIIFILVVLVILVVFLECYCALLTTAFEPFILLMAPGVLRILSVDYIARLLPTLPPASTTRCSRGCAPDGGQTMCMA